MKRWTQTAMLCLTLAVPTACEKGESNPDQVAQLQREEVGTIWRTLLQNIENTTDDDTKVKLLSNFIASNPDHPDVADAQRRLDKLTNSPDKAAKEAVAKEAQLGIEEGKPQALFALILSTAVDRRTPRHERDALAAPVEVATTEGMAKVEKSLFEHPLVLRSHVRRALQTHAADEVEKRCGRECVNETLGKFLAKSVGGALYKEDGKLNPDAIGPLLEQSWVDPSAKLLNVDAKSWYEVFKPTAQAYYKVGKAVEAHSPEQAAQTLAGLSDTKEVRDFYTKFATDNKIAEESGVEPGDARAIAGWWLRRYADGTAKLFSDQATKMAEQYDPELIAK